MHTGSAMSWVYLSIVRLRQVVVVFLRVPILSTIRLSTFSWNFIVDRFKSCLFFSLLNIAAAATAAASIRSKRNLAKHIVPFFVTRIYVHIPMWYLRREFIYMVNFCVRSKQNCDSKFSEVYRGKGKRSKQKHEPFSWHIQKATEKNSLDFFARFIAWRSEWWRKSLCTMWKTEKFKHTVFENKQSFQKWMDNFFYKHPIHIKEK